MILIDVFSGMSQLDARKRGLQKFQPYGRTETDKPNRMYVEQTVFDFDVSQNSNGSFWLDKVTTIYDLKLNGVEIPAAIMKVSGRKNIVTTPLAGQDNAVIEIVGFQYYEIQVGGVVIDEAGFPQNQTADLNRLFRLNESLEVECEFLRLFDIHFLVVQDFDFPPAEGFDNVIPFEFTSFSDQPIELELKDGILPVL